MRRPLLLAALLACTVLLAEVTILHPGISQTATVVPAFTDVPATHPHATAINYLREQGLIRGNPDGTYRPDDPINRAEFASMIINPVADVSVQQQCAGSMAQSPFRDVAGSEWFMGSLCIAVQNDIISGYPDKTYRATNTIIFAEAAQIVSKTYGIRASAPPASTMWYAPAVAALAENNIIPAGITSVSDTVDRGQMATILYRSILRGMTPVAYVPYNGTTQPAMEAPSHAAAPAEPTFVYTLPPASAAPVQQMQKSPIELMRQQVIERLAAQQGTPQTTQPPAMPQSGTTPAQPQGSATPEVFILQSQPEGGTQASANPGTTEINYSEEPKPGIPPPQTCIPPEEIACPAMVGIQVRCVNSCCECVTVTDASSSSSKATVIIPTPAASSRRSSSSSARSVMSTAPTPPPPAPRTPYCANSVLEPGEDCDFWNCKKENNLCIRKAPLLTEEGTFTAQEYNGSNSTESFPPRQDGWFQASCDNREGPACGGYLTKDQRLFVSTSTYGSMKIDPVKPGTFEPYARLDTLAPMVMSGDGRYVAAHALGELPSIHYFDMLTRTYKRLAVYGSLVSLAISHDGQTIAYGVRGGFYVIDLRAGTTTAVSTPLTLLRTNPDYTYMHRVSDDGQRIAYKEYESTHAGVTIAWFRVYDRTTGAHQTMPVSRDVGWPLFDAAARRMVYYVKPAEEKGTVWLYDFASGSNTAFLEGTPYNDGTLFCGRFSADGRICTLAGRGGAAVGTKIDVDTGQVIPH